MESDFGINVNNRGTILSQIEGLGILHGINKDDIYDFIKKIILPNLQMMNFIIAKKL